MFVLTNNYHFRSYFLLVCSKGQLISKGLFDVIVWTKKPTKFFKDFCLASKKRSDETACKNVIEVFLLKETVQMNSWNIFLLLLYLEKWYTIALKSLFFESLRTESTILLLFNSSTVKVELEGFQRFCGDYPQKFNVPLFMWKSLNSIRPGMKGAVCRCNNDIKSL